MAEQTAATTGIAWMTLGEVAEYSRYSLRTVRAAVADGSLRTVKHRHQRRTRRDWVDAWLLGTVPAEATAVTGPAS